MDNIGDTNATGEDSLPNSLAEALRKLCRPTSPSDERRQFFFRQALIQLQKDLESQCDALSELPVRGGLLAAAAASISGWLQQESSLNASEHLLLGMMIMVSSPAMVDVRNVPGLTKVADELLQDPDVPEGVKKIIRGMKTEMKNESKSDIGKRFPSSDNFIN